MGIIEDTKASFGRVRGYGNRMTSLLSRYEVRGTDDVKRVAKDSTFKSELAALWKEILEAEGGAITLTILLSTIAIAMGGVGIAAGGGAIGLPLIVILAPVGYFTGQELDSEGYTKAVVNTFAKLLQMAEKLDFEHYNEVVAGKIKELDTQRDKYTERVIGVFNKLRGKTGEASST